MNEIIELKMELAKTLREKGYYPPQTVDRLIEALESNLDGKKLLSLSAVQATDILPRSRLPQVRLKEQEENDAALVNRIAKNKEKELQKALRDNA